MELCETRRMPSSDARTVATPRPVPRPVPVPPRGEMGVATATPTVRGEGGGEAGLARMFVRGDDGVAMANGGQTMAPPQVWPFELAPGRAAESPLDNPSDRQSHFRAIDSVQRGAVHRCAGECRRRASRVSVLFRVAHSLPQPTPSCRVESLVCADIEDEFRVPEPVETHRSAVVVLLARFRVPGVVRRLLCAARPHLLLPP